MVIPIEMLEKTNIKQHQAIIDKVNDIVDVVNSQGLETIKDTVNDVKARVGVLENENDTQDTEISQLGTRVSAVEQKNATQDSQISEVTGRMATAEGKITALENDKADTTDVTALANRVTAVEQKNTSQDTEISTVTDKVGTIEIRTDAIEDDVTSIQGSITSLENDKADTTDVTALGNRVTAVEQKNTSQDTEISELGTRITAVEGEIPDISYNGPFYTNLGLNQSGGDLTLDFTAKKLDGTTTYPYITFPHATETTDGIIKLNEVVLKNQGTANAGKALVVGSDGMVAPGDVGGGGSGAVWGQITGDIANQTDLQSEINEKVDKTAVATASALGLVKIGSGISVTADGTISATGGGGGSAITTFQFNGDRGEEDFAKLRDWINAVGSYKQISANINSSNGAYTIRISMGNSGKAGAIFWGGGSFFSNNPSVFYPMSDCTFRVSDEDTITINAYYIMEDGNRTGHNFSFKPGSYIDGSAFVIN